MRSPRLQRILSTMAAQQRRLRSAPEISPTSTPSSPMFRSSQAERSDSASCRQHAQSPRTASTNSLLTPLWCAVAVSNVPLIVELVLNLPSSELLRTDSVGRTVLHVASKDGQPACCQSLVLAAAGYDATAMVGNGAAAQALRIRSALGGNPIAPALALLRSRDSAGQTAEEVAPDSTTANALRCAQSFVLRTPLLLYRSKAMSSGQHRQLRLSCESQMP